MSSTASCGSSHCGKCPDRSNQCSFASGNSCVARFAWLGNSTRSLRPQPMTSGPGSEPAGAPSCVGPWTSECSAASNEGEMRVAAHLAQSQVGGQRPGSRRELGQQKGTPDRAAGDGGHDRLKQAHQPDGRLQRSVEKAQLPRAPEAAGRQRDRGPADAATGELDHLSMHEEQRFAGTSSDRIHANRVIVGERECSAEFQILAPECRSVVLVGRR